MTAHYLQDLLYNLLKDFRKYLFYLLIEVIILISKTSQDQPDLVLVDFNINALRDSPLLDTMRQRQYVYTLLGTELTQIMGGLLGHIYIRNNANFFCQSNTSDTTYLLFTS